MKNSIAGLALVALASAFAAQAQEGMTEAKVRSTLQDQGYRDVTDVAFKHGLWSADAKTGDGKKVDVSIDPKTGTVYSDADTSPLSQAEIQSRLSAAGYTDIGETKFDDGLWEAKARDANGKKVEVKVEPKEGKVISTEQD